VGIMLSRYTRRDTTQNQREARAALVLVTSSCDLKLISELRFRQLGQRWWMRRSSERRARALRLVRQVPMPRAVVW